MTNRKKWFWENSGDDLEKMKQGAKMIAMVRGDATPRLAETCLSLVLTNAVDIQNIGVGLYDFNFSWINHSCSPNSCVRFLMGKGKAFDDEENEGLMMIRPITGAPAPRAVGELKCPKTDDGYESQDALGSYGPRLVLRSIRSIKMDEEVTVTYSDLIQPREIRLENLLSKYRFSCNCYRCAAGYTDSALRAFSIEDPMYAKNSRDEIMNMMQKLQLPEGNFSTFCQEVEEFLCSGEIHPYHCIGLEAYRALASAYKLQGAAIDCVEEAVKKYKTSSAYSVFLAGIVYHFLEFEPSFVMTAEECWRNAGLSVLTFWTSECANLNGAFFEFKLEHKCEDCVFLADLDLNLGQKEKAKQFEVLKGRLHSCLAYTTSKVWDYLASESLFLTSVNDVSQGDQDEFSHHTRRDNILKLGLHCLRLAALFSSICYGNSVDTNYASSISAARKAMGLE